MGRQAGAAMDREVVEGGQVPAKFGDRTNAASLGCEAALGGPAGAGRLNYECNTMQESRNASEPLRSVRCDTGKSTGRRPDSGSSDGRPPVQAGWLRRLGHLDAHEGR